MNSRLLVSNHAFLNTLIRDCANRADSQLIRAVLVIRSAPENWLKEFAQRHNHEYLPQISSTDRSDRISKLLGSERSSAVIQLGQKPDLGLLAALAGTVRAGGALIIGIPSLAPSARSPHNSLKRLTCLAQHAAENHAGHMMFVDYTPPYSSLPSSGTELSDGVSQPSSMQHTPHAFKNPLAAAEQDALLDKAYRHITTHDRARIVITGRRGRGKSTLIARLAAKLSQNGIDTRVTAMHESALSTFRQVAGDNGHYLSPESIIKEAVVDALMVDEAASFPIAQLEAYADKCRHLVLSTTVEGYETAGRALALRVLPAADSADNSTARQAMLQLTPEYPWRWSAHDPLEEFVDRLLLTYKPPGAAEFETITPADAMQLAKQSLTRLIRRDELLGDEALFAHIYALLLSNHYQSGTKDLEHLLDAPTVQLWICQSDNQVIGVLLLEFEGNIDGDLHEEVLAKRRRLKNQLLPQLLAQMANSTAALSRGYARVLRLTVTPALRRQGIASEMLKTVISSLRSVALERQDEIPVDTVDAIGASFAADKSSVAFWHSLGFNEFHRGFKANPRTGKCAVAVMQTCDPICSAVLEKAVSIHSDNELVRSGRLQSDPSHTLSDDTLDSFVDTVSELDRSVLQRFAMGHRSLHDTTAALHRIATLLQLPLRAQAGESRKRHEQLLRNRVLHWLEEG